MYKGKIIDTHMHLCDLTTDNYDWLVGDRPEMREILGDEGYAFIKKSFSPQDYVALAAKENIVAAVHLQYEANDNLQETRWLTHCADEAGVPSALVAKVNLSDDDAEAQLSAHCESEYMRGIRMLLTYVEGNAKLSLTDQDYFQNPVWQKQFSLLKKFNLRFDVQIFDSQAAQLAAVASQHPEIPIMINHLLWPIDSSESGFDFWRKQVAAVAACDNIMMKISGASLIFNELDVKYVQPYIDTVLEYFTPARCVVGSNYPPDGAYASFHDIWQGLRKGLQGLSADEQAQIFYDNAKQFYAIDE